MAYFAQNLKSVTAKGSINIDKPGIEGNDYNELNKAYFEEKYPDPIEFAKEFKWSQSGGNEQIAIRLILHIWAWYWRMKTLLMIKCQI